MRKTITTLLSAVVLTLGVVMTSTPAEAREFPTNFDVPMFMWYPAIPAGLEGIPEPDAELGRGGPMVAGDDLPAETRAVLAQAVETTPDKVAGVYAMRYEDLNSMTGETYVALQVYRIEPDRADPEGCTIVQMPAEWPGWAGWNE